MIIRRAAYQGLRILETDPSTCSKRNERSGKENAMKLSMNTFLYKISKMLSKEVKEVSCFNGNHAHKPSHNLDLGQLHRLTLCSND